MALLASGSDPHLCRFGGEVMMMLTDTQWAMLEPLVESCRPHAKVPPANLRRTVAAILWRCTNGAKWRAIPAVDGWLGPPLVLWAGGASPVRDVCALQGGRPGPVAKF